MFVNIKLKSKLVVIWTTILIILIGVIITLITTVKKKVYGEKIVLKDNKLNITSYYLEADVTVISNKNINTYNLKEWYKEGVGNKFVFLDSKKNETQIITNQNECYIKNNANKAEIKTENLYEKSNILSLSTFIHMYNTKNSCSCKKEMYSKEESINITINICGAPYCENLHLFNQMKIKKMELTIKNNLPNIYVAYDINNKEYIYIVYNNVETNIQLQENVFNINGIGDGSIK